MTIYAIPIEIQRSEISYYCFDHCGRVVFAPIMDTDLGGLSHCRVDQCPFLAGQIDNPFGEISGELVYLRKLMSVPVRC